MGLKQVIVLRGDLNLSRGKQVAQGCHASLHSFVAADTDTREAWLEEGATKVVVEAENRERLHRLKETAEASGIAATLVTDAGKTEVAAGTVTALGVGPAEEDKVDKVTGSLPLLR